RVPASEVPKRPARLHQLSRHAGGVVRRLPCRRTRLHQHRHGHQPRGARHRSRRPGGASSMSKRRHLLTAAGMGALTTMLLATSAAEGVGPGPSRAPILLGADPSAVTIAPLPGDRRGEVALSMTNTGGEGEFVDALLTASPGLELSRELWSTYLPPADPTQAVSAPVTVTAAEPTTPGEHELQMAAAEERKSR